MKQKSVKPFMVSEDVDCDEATTHSSLIILYFLSSSSNSKLIMLTKSIIVFTDVGKSYNANLKHFCFLLHTKESKRI